MYDDTGRIVVGLSLNKGDGYFYATGTGTAKGNPRVRFGKDRRDAVSRFRQWATRREGGNVRFVDASPFQDQHTGETGIHLDISHTSENEFLKTVSEWLQNPNKRRKVAEFTQLPLERLFDGTLAGGTPLSLAKCLNLYMNRLQPVSRNEAKQVRLAWGYFTSWTKAKTVNDISRDSVVEWITHLDKTYARKTRNTRINRIKTVLRYAIKQEQAIQ